MPSLGLGANCGMRWASGCSRRRTRHGYPPYLDARDRAHVEIRLGDGGVVSGPDQFGEVPTVRGAKQIAAVARNGRPELKGAAGLYNCNSLATVEADGRNQATCSSGQRLPSVASAISASQWPSCSVSPVAVCRDGWPVALIGGAGEQARSGSGAHPAVPRRWSHLTLGGRARSRDGKRQPHPTKSGSRLPHRPLGQDRPNHMYGRRIDRPCYLRVT